MQVEHAPCADTAWLPASLISEYDYLGGGLLHSRQTKYVKETSGLHAGAIFPIVSDFEHDDLLRVTSVRHWRDDTAVPGLGQYRLLGRYDYSYDQNSMMLWEARWHDDDQAGASTTPDEADFYAYSGDNQLTKAAYNVTRFGADFPIDLAGLPLAYNAHFNDDTDNTLTCSDRVYYGRRKSSTRDRVNWYRGAANRTALPSGQNDTTTGPTQKTHYDTSDDPTADPDNPAADGGGSRHNYTVIGQGLRSKRTPAKHCFAGEPHVRQEPSFASQCAAQVRSLREPCSPTAPASSGTTTRTSFAMCGASPTAIVAKQRA